MRPLQVILRVHVALGTVTLADLPGATPKAWQAALATRHFGGVRGLTILRG